MIRLLAGDCRDVLATLPAESVQCVVTSPPYYGLRDYGTALWDGGDAGCEHLGAFHSSDPVPPSCRQCKKCGRLSRTKWLTASSVRSECDQCGVSTDYTDVASRGTWITDTVALWKGGHEGERGTVRDRLANICPCGAVRVDRQIGLEATPDEYLATMVGVFREVRRVLRRDGTCWVNMGDSYNSSAGGATPRGLEVGRILAGAHPVYRKGDGRGKTTTLKPKDLLMMPTRLALALQADGWWVRSDIIWHKPNPMPESCRDRPTSAHEHVFLLTRSSRYFYDADAVREAHQDHNVVGGVYVKTALSAADYEGRKWADRSDGISRPPMTIRDREYHPAGRNMRNVWTIATHAYPKAHFATFPPELAERCIKAGTSERGCCAACGKPWVRMTEQATIGHTGRTASAYPAGSSANRLALLRQAARERGGEYAAETTTTGWSPGCQCGTTEARPCVVLDPFIGAGTTALVADRLQRDVIGIDLNTQYTRMAMERCRADAPLFTAFPPAEPPEDERMADLFTDMAAD